MNALMLFVGRQEEHWACENLQHKSYSSFLGTYLF